MRKLSLIIIIVPAYMHATLGFNPNYRLVPNAET